MPKLLIFAPCEKVAVGQQDNSSCLIGILQAFELGGISEAGETQIEESKTQQVAPLRVPLHWTIFAFWRLNEDERGKIFEQSCQLITPSGKVSFDQVMEFGQDPTEFQRVTINAFGFPVPEEGEYTLKVSIGERGEPRIEKATYPLTVKRKANRVSPQEAS